MYVVWSKTVNEGEREGDDGAGLIAAAMLAAAMRVVAALCLPRRNQGLRMQRTFMRVAILVGIGFKGQLPTNMAGPILASVGILRIHALVVKRLSCPAALARKVAEFPRIVLIGN